MNIFCIPSWYPSKSNPVSGLFIKEQALALGRHSNCQVIISLWGNDTKINFEKPLQVLPHLINFFEDKPYSKKITPRTFEFNQPALEWSARFFKGNIKSIIEANIINFKRMQSQFGKIDLIHAHVSFPAGYVAMKLSERYHLPYIITEHMGPFPLKPFVGNKRLLPLVIEPLEKADQVIAVSSKLQSELLKYKIKSVVVPNLVDESYFTLASQKKHQNFTFFSLGEISPEKGFEDLIKTIAKVSEKDDKIMFRIGGQGKYLKKYKNLAKNLRISQNITWLGSLFRKQVLKEIQKCDAFILPSHHESFGMVFLEALACGKPIIATHCGGPEEIVTKENGLLVPMGDVEKISQAILKLVNNIGNYDSYKIRKHFLANFSKKAVVPKIVEIYQKLCVG